MFKNPAAYVKAYAGWIGGIVSAVLVLLPGVGVDVPPWVAIVSLVLTAVSVQALPNVKGEGDE